MNELTLTEEQRALVGIDEGPVLVTAPPGSGKTEVVVQRIVRLLEESSGQSFRVLALTFTTKAAEALTARVRDRVGNEAWRAWISTIHSFCLEVLRHYGEPVGVTPEATVYETREDRLQVLAEGLQEAGYDIDDRDSALGELLNRIDRFRRDLVMPEEVEDEYVAGIPVGEAYETYLAMLRQYGAVDFDGILFLTYRLFIENPRIAKHYRQIYRYLMLDEAQDTNRAQYEILRELCGDENQNFFVVADANQSMYRFSGASDEYIRRFVEEFRAKEMTLTTNFRSAEAIVEVANALVQHSPRLRGKAVSMRAAGSAPGFVAAESFADERAEAMRVVDWAAELLDSGLHPEWLMAVERETRRTVAPEEICILGRSRFSLANVVDALEERGIEYQFRVGEREFFDSDTYRSLFFGLRLISNPRDLPARRNLVSVISQDDSWPSAELREMRSDDLSSLAERLGSTSRLQPLADLLKSADADVDSLVQRGLEFDIDAMDVEDQAIPLIRADREVFESRWAEYQARVRRDDRSLPGFLAYLSVARRVTLDGPGVRVLTVHSAKGLEFRAVALVGLNEGGFPDYRNLDSAVEVDDERRNAYVAVTRAERALLLTRPRTRITRYGNRRVQETSRFVPEMRLQMVDR